MRARAQHQSGEPPTLLCLAHLEWDHVWQRPQQLMTRHTRRYQVWYVDPPRLSETVAAPELHDLGLSHGVRVMRPLFPSAQAAQPEGYWAAWHALLPELVAQAGRNTVMWAFSPYADQLVERARSQIRLTVYDCMDDLASFKDGSPELRMREARLLELADLVFTGGALDVRGA